MRRRREQLGPSWEQKAPAFTRWPSPRWVCGTELQPQKFQNWWGASVWGSGWRKRRPWTRNLKCYLLWFRREILGCSQPDKPFHPTKLTFKMCSNSYTMYKFIHLWYNTNCHLTHNFIMTIQIHATIYFWKTNIINSKVGMFWKILLKFINNFFISRAVKNAEN